MVILSKRRLADPATEEDRVYSIAEAAAFLGVAANTVHSMIKNRRLGARREPVTLRWVIDGPDLLEAAHKIVHKQKRKRPMPGVLPIGRPKGARQRTWPLAADIAVMDCSPLRKALLLEHHTTEVAADRLGISISMLGMVLRGETGLTDQLAFAAERLYGVSFDELKRYHFELARRKRADKAGRP